MRKGKTACLRERFCWGFWRLCVFVVVGDGGVVNVSGSFDKTALLEAAQENGDTEVTVMGKLTSGRWFYGSSIVRVFDSAEEL